MSDEVLPATPSQAGIVVPPAPVAQLPPAVARHPIATTIIAVVTAIGATVGSIAAINPGSDAEAISGNATKLDTVVSAQEDAKAEQAAIKNSLARFTERADDRITDLEKRMDKADGYHERGHGQWLELAPWQRDVLRRLDKLEK